MNQPALVFFFVLVVVIAAAISLWLILGREEKVFVVTDFKYGNRYSTATVKWSDGSMSRVYGSVDWCYEDSGKPLPGYVSDRLCEIHCHMRYLDSKKD